MRAAVDIASGRCGRARTAWRCLVVTFVSQYAATEQEQRDRDNNRRQQDAGDRGGLDPGGGSSHSKRCEGGNNAPPRADFIVPLNGCAARQEPCERRANRAIEALQRGFARGPKIEPAAAKRPGPETTQSANREKPGFGARSRPP